MSDLGEISADLSDALDRLDRVLTRFADLDRRQLASLQAQMERSPQQRQAAAMVARARALLKQAGDGAGVARGSGAEWLAQHGSSQSGSSSGGGTATEAGAEPMSFRGGGSFASANAESAWAEGIRTPGGRAYYPPEEQKLRQAATTLPEFPGEYTFDAHGRSDRVEVGDRELTASEVVELIRADSEWGHRSIRLFSCNTGRGDTPIAQEVADQTGVKVTAPDGYAWSAADGRSGVAPIEVSLKNGVVVEGPDYSREGSWRDFNPS